MKYFIIGIILGLSLLASVDAQACRTIVLPDGTVLIVCCDAQGNCTYN